MRDEDGGEQMNSKRKRHIGHKGEEKAPGGKRNPLPKVSEDTLSPYGGGNPEAGVRSQETSVRK